MKIKNKPKDKGAGLRRAGYIMVGVILVATGVVGYLMLRDDAAEQSSEFVFPYADEDAVSGPIYEEPYPTEDTAASNHVDTIPPMETVKASEDKGEKKKPLDPRFQHPDGTYKQPWEYMEYFNEDEDDDYEDGYDDGWDDAED